MFVLAGVLGIIGAFGILELIMYLNLDHILETTHQLGFWLLVGGALGGFLVQVVTWL